MGRAEVRPAPEVLRLQEWPDPVPGPGQALVRVRAIGLNFADCAARLGVYPRVPPAPFVPGMEVSGEVIGLGDGVAGPPRLARRRRADLRRSRRAGGRESGFTASAARPDRLCRGSRAGGHRTHRRSRAVHRRAAAPGRAGARQRGRGRGRDDGGADGRGGRCGGGRGRIDGRQARSGGEPRRRSAFGYERYREALAGGVDVVVDSVGGRLFRPGWKALRADGRYVLFGFAAAIGARRVRYIRAALELARMGAVLPAALVQPCRTLAGFNLSLVPKLAAELQLRFERLEAMIASVDSARWSARSSPSRVCRQRTLSCRAAARPARWSSPSDEPRPARFLPPPPGPTLRSTASRCLLRRIRGWPDAGPGAPAPEPACSCARDRTGRSAPGPLAVLLPRIRPLGRSHRHPGADRPSGARGRRSTMATRGTGGLDDTPPTCRRSCSKSRIWPSRR